MVTVEQPIRHGRTPVKKRSAGVVVVRQFDAGPRMLILRCFGYWDFPKGELDPEEEPLAAAQREVMEEAGLDDLLFRWGEVYIETPPYGQGKVARYYIAESTSGDAYLPISPELGVPENHEFRWVGYPEASALLNDRVGAVLDWAWQRISDAARG